MTPSVREQIRIIPIPANVKFGGDSFVIGGEIGLYISASRDARLETLVANSLQGLIDKTGVQFTNEGPGLHVQCVNPDPFIPQADSDESYSVHVLRDKITLQAKSYLGVLHGIQSITQLAEFKEGKWQFPGVVIQDEPRYSWRGLMIDVARNWIPKDALIRTLDAMSKVKMNVLHLHLSDDQAFRVECKTFPGLHELGSNGNYFTQEDIQEIIIYAANKGIRIIPEFDMPGHSNSWFIGYPELATRKGTYTPHLQYGPHDAIMDPVSNSTYRFLELFLTEMAGLFPDKYFHIGIDEVLPDQWEESQSVKEFMQEKNLATQKDLLAYFSLRVNRILDKVGKNSVAWDEAIHPEIAGPSSVIQSWRGHETLFEAIRLGHSGILSSGWYLDHKLPISHIYSIDPARMPSDVTIEPDPEHWSCWEFEMELNESPEKGLIFLFGEDDFRGVIRMMDRNNVFTDAERTAQGLQFGFKSSFGEIQAKLNTAEDSIFGDMKLALFNIPMTGRKIGGDDFEGGIPLPNFVRARDMSTEEMDRILGGEACLWTEFVSSRTLDSRIWPRAAAVAEKLWSRQDMTTDVEDFYRRLEFLQSQLRDVNQEIRKNQLEVLQEMTDSTVARDLMILVDLLEEVKYYDRWNYHSDHNAENQLNYLADAALPESIHARNFSRRVDAFLEQPDDEMLKEEILRDLRVWSGLYQQVKGSLMEDPALKNIEILCLLFSDLAEIARLKMSNGSLSSDELAYYEKIKAEAVKPRDAVILKNAESLIRLIDRHMEVL